MTRTALVTGGSRGIGRAIALQLAAQGCNVAVNYATRSDAADEVVTAIRDAGGDALAVGADVSDAVPWSRCSKRSARRSTHPRSW